MASLIDGYRELYNRDDMPFYYAQLPRFSNQDFSHIRSAQFWALNKVKNKANVGLVSTLDEVGNFGSDSDTSGTARFDVHPWGKKEIASRFVRYIKHDIYGMDDVTAHGPMYESSEINGNTITLTFDCTGSLSLMPKSQYADFKTPADLNADIPGEFEIAGANGIYYSADAVIDGNTVTLSSPSVPEPKNARYCYSPYPEAPNLTDASGLPSYTFCTEYF